MQCKVPRLYMALAARIRPTVPPDLDPKHGWRKATQANIDLKSLFALVISTFKKRCWVANLHANCDYYKYLHKEIWKNKHATARRSTCVVWFCGRFPGTCGAYLTSQSTSVTLPMLQDVGSSAVTCNVVPVQFGDKPSMLHCEGYCIRLLQHPTQASAENPSI